MAAGKTAANATRYRERWLTHPSPRAVFVSPPLTGGTLADQPTAPCFLCESRGPCRHREVEYA